MSTHHRKHPVQGKWNEKEYNDPEDVVLYDDCDRCKEHAQFLVSLDNRNLHLMWQEMIKVEYINDRDYYRTRTEALACRQLYTTSLIIYRLFGVEARDMNAQGLRSAFSAD